VSFSNTPETRVDGTKFLNTGNIPAKNAATVGVEFAAQKQNLLLQSEYEHFSVDRSDGLSSPEFSGYYVEGVWTLTGEARKYNTQTAAFDAPPVAHPFSLTDGGWGALELGIRYSEMDLNYKAGAAGTLQTGSAIRGGDETNLTAGLNWYPNNFVRFMLNYEHIRIDRLSPAATTTAANTIWFTPAGAQIGQNYDVFAVRSQFAF
jgi:phosphate-selective porin OprO/OprP